MKPNYETIQTPTGNTVINAIYKDGQIISIPMDEANSDYQAYLDRDNPKAALSTPIATK